MLSRQVILDDSSNMPNRSQAGPNLLLCWPKPRNQDRHYTDHGAIFATILHSRSRSQGSAYHGIFRAWLDTPLHQKRIQGGPWQECFELYIIPDSSTSLTKYFDWYLRDIDNGCCERHPRYGERR